MNPDLQKKYEPVIGLEVHAQMLTKSKAFCGCSTEFGALPNHNTCPICLGHPGTLPVLNENLLRFIVRMGLATNCQIRERSIFARKNYFYPDLPKGYQISQYETPICYDGYLNVEMKDGGEKCIGITRIHMEEDAGKSIHDFGAETLVDLNRAGVPLIEIVSEPDMRSSDEAYAYLTTIKSIVTYLGICDGNMEEGSLRCDANVSVRLRGTEKFGQKTEVKNMNSFRNVQRAIEAEIERQIGLIENSQPVIHQTMLFDANKGVTRAMRSKEEAHDYRYFPEPDLLPVTVSEEYLAEVREEIPELQRARRDRLIKKYKLSKYDADILTQDKQTADFFENSFEGSTNPKEATSKRVANFIIGPVFKIKTETPSLYERINPIRLFELAELTEAHLISPTAATTAIQYLPNNPHSAKDIIKEKGLEQVSDRDALLGTIREVIAKNQAQLGQYKEGKVNLFGFFVGQTMKATQGKANPEMVNEIMKEELEKA
ncbi:MAG TPA: Asp-tRNA(Asn)/Glu-tRNA(Gln) amidotransferase subunit GatB [Candidatus Kapabacteria bacterium]|jgi:aspartyl-tRNA(Asn)/glutamyl-tRNA(Gln) amidotransferase subunit B|nr:Asp-tRNA(Asn)/Glu-tRNA(Gln) amidotransferase subunit GatB [Candidatus Kapabacteria bacterium]